jgi:hypothetical protein
MTILSTREKFHALVLESCLHVHFGNSMAFADGAHGAAGAAFFETGAGSAAALPSVARSAAGGAIGGESGGGWRGGAGAGAAAPMLLVRVKRRRGEDPSDSITMRVKKRADTKDQAHGIQLRRVECVHANPTRTTSNSSCFVLS